MRRRTASADATSNLAASSTAEMVALVTNELLKQFYHKGASAPTAATVGSSGSAATPRLAATSPANVAPPVNVDPTESLNFAVSGAINTLVQGGQWRLVAK